MPTPECTYYEHARQSDCLRPVELCGYCWGRRTVNRLSSDLTRTVPVPCPRCRGTGGDRCAKHPREEE